MTPKRRAKRKKIRVTKDNPVDERLLVPFEDAFRWDRCYRALDYLLHARGENFELIKMKAGMILRDMVNDKD